MSAAQREALEARFALRVSARLEAGAQSLPHDIGERLRVAREQAVRLAREQARAASAVVSTTPVVAPVVSTAPAIVAVGQGGAGVMGAWNEPALSRLGGHGRQLDENPSGWGWRLAAALPALALVCGLWGIHLYHKHEQAQAAAEVDTALLADDLPPSAYADPGFAEFVRNDSDETSSPAASDAPGADTQLDSADTAAASDTP